VALLAKRCDRQRRGDVAALAVWGTASAWPDLAVAGMMAGIFLTSSVQILKQAWTEYRSGYLSAGMTGAT